MPRVRPPRYHARMSERALLMATSSVNSAFRPHSDSWWSPSGLASLAYPPGETDRVRPDPAPGQVATTDARMFAAVVERLRSGESYYDAMGAELQRRDYPTHVVFNWRTPLHLTMVALAPWAVWRGVLTGLLVAVFVATMLVARDLLTRRSAGLLLLGVLVLFAAQDAVFVSEAWAGPLLALSACAFALGRAGIGIGCALAALFIRELAAPYCVIGTLLALRNRRWRAGGGLAHRCGRVCAVLRHGTWRRCWHTARRPTYRTRPRG